MMFRKPKMRPADPREMDFHVLEALSQPLACVTAPRIGIWVYRIGPLIREIVISGHAELLTCSQATSLLIECIKELDGNVRWGLTAGAGFIRIGDDYHASPPLGLSTLLGGGNNQAHLSQLVSNLHDLESENGLVKVLERDWRDLQAFRLAFRAQTSSGQPLVLTPRGATVGYVADYLPIVPEKNKKAAPLVFTLEGWDFDCPEFQAVADRHLQNVQRKLLSDAQRRRLKYRSWLKDWMEMWVPELSYLPAEQAQAVRLQVPPSHDAGAGTTSQSVEVQQFLQKIAADFLDRGQTWPHVLAMSYSQYGGRSAEELDKSHIPEFVNEIDFERAIEIKRQGTKADAYTLRQQIREARPRMISNCLSYIRLMDGIIQPYERLRSHMASSAEPSRGLSKEDRGIQVVADISRRIVMETMIRGWPSIYLSDKRDQEVFERWEKRVRAHVWSVLCKQARVAGVAIEQLLEDNVIYDVRFNDDLGCTVQPLVLADDVSHAQIHGSRAGASVVVPIWKRAVSRTVPESVLALGGNNEERARALVERAARRIHDYPGTSIDSVPDSVIRDLRLALACAPGQAGRCILEEWTRRLGRDTSKEFDVARLLVEAVELCSRSRFAEAAPRLAEYLKREPRPVQDAHARAALCELIGKEQRYAEYRDCAVQEALIRQHHEALLEKHPELSPDMDHDALMKKIARNPGLVNDLERLKQLTQERERLGNQVELLKSGITADTDRFRKMIQEALDTPGEWSAPGFPAWARAAREAPDALQVLLEAERIDRPQLSVDFFRRYWPVRGLIETRGLVDLVFALSILSHRIEENPNQARQDALPRMEELSRDLWLPGEVELDLKMVGKEFGKGDWDRIQALQIRGVLDKAIGTCQARLRDLMSDSSVTEAPFAEVLETRIHLVQVFEGRYRTALGMLLNATTRFGRVTAKPWKVLDDTTDKVPDEAHLEFRVETAQVEMVASDGMRIPLLQGMHMSAAEISHVARLLDDPHMIQRIYPRASSVAEGLLAIEVSPSEAWHAWREAMRAVQEELLFAISSFRHQACLLPEHMPVPPAPEEGVEEKERRNRVPRLEPEVDWSWIDLDRWTDLVGPAPRRAHLEWAGLSPRTS